MKIIIKYNKAEKDYIFLYSLLFLSIFIVFLSFLGSFLNIFVVKSNGNKMPVYSNVEFETEKHISFNQRNEDNFKYLFLSDIIYIPNKKMMVSIGDIFLFMAYNLIKFLIVVHSLFLIYLFFKSRKPKDLNT